MKRMKNVIIILFFMCMFLPMQAKAANTDIKDAQFTDGFEKVSDYDAYLKSDESLKDKMIWVEGVARSYNAGSHSLIIKTADGDWAAYCGDEGTDHFYELVSQIIGKEVRIFGKYTGTSAGLGVPEVSFIDKNIYDKPCRLETNDNHFRLFYGDYIFNKPEYDTVKTYGVATFDVAGEFREEETTDTLFYYYTDDVPSFLMVHTDDLTDSSFDKFSDDELLKTFGEVYLESSDNKLIETEVEVDGRKGLYCETTFTVADCPCPMSLICYMTVIDRNFYYFGSTQPYLSSETFKEVLVDVVKSIRTEDVAANLAALGSEKKYPKLSEIGGLYTMTVEIVRASGKTNKDTGTNLYFGIDDFTSYNETTGVGIIEWDGFSMVMNFQYDKDGSIICSGTINADNAVGTIVGKKTG